MAKYSSHLKLMTILGQSISTNEQGLVSLTDLWKAAGSKNHEKPSLWLLQEKTSQFIGTVEENLKGRKDDLLKSTRGRHNGGTFAHWQIALAYAEWLSPKLHMAVNDIYMRYKMADPTSLPWQALAKAPISEV